MASEVLTEVAPEGVVEAVLGVRVDGNGHFNEGLAVKRGAAAAVVLDGPHVAIESGTRGQGGTRRLQSAAEGAGSHLTARSPPAVVTPS